MIWIEMSRDSNRSDNSWGLGRSLHSPTRTEDGTKHGHWETLLEVQEGDTVLHLFGDKNPSFVGHSVADSDGYETRSQPPGTSYDYEINRRYRVHLCNFTRFENPYPIEELFREKEEEIVRYYEKNKNRSESDKRKILPVVQGGELQCLNGAYLTEVDEELREIIFDFFDTKVGVSENDSSAKKPSDVSVDTGTSTAELEIRSGQKDFSDDVKENYGYQCCFPGCDVSHPRFLIGAHIARWADAPKLRGRIDNGLCLCLMHDKAFEYGWFTLTLDHKVWIAEERVENSEWARENLAPQDGHEIDTAPIMPGEEPLFRHWERLDLYPEPDTS
jgi:Predicted restriction endonuclease